MLSARLRRVAIRIAVGVLAMAGIPFFQAEQASAATCGVWTGLGQPTNFTIAGKYAGQAYLEWNNCAGINYETRGHWQWSYSYNVNPPAGVVGAYVRVMLTEFDPGDDTIQHQWDASYLNDGWVGNTQNNNPVAGPVYGYGTGSGTFNVWVETKTDWSNGTSTYCGFGFTDAHNFNNGSTPELGRDETC